MDLLQGGGRGAKRPVAVVLESAERKADDCCSKEGSEQETEDDPDIAEEFPVTVRCCTIHANLWNGTQRWEIQKEAYVDQSVRPRRRGYAEGQAGSECEAFLQEEQTAEREGGKQALRVSGCHEHISRREAVQQAGEQSEPSVLKNRSAEGVQGDRTQQEEGAVPQGDSQKQAAPHTEPIAEGPQQGLRKAPQHDGEEGEKGKVVLVDVSPLCDEEKMLRIPVGEAAKQPVHHRVQVQGLFCTRGPEGVGFVVGDGSIQDSLKSNRSILF